jgi:plastocyanin
MKRLDGLRGALLRVLFLPVLCLPALCMPAAINGKVVLAGAMPPAKKLDVTIDQYLCGKEKDTQDLVISTRGEIANAVVWLENAPPDATGPAVASKATIDQVGCLFVPRVVVVAAGGTVDFLNSDRLLHNIHATPKLNVSFNRTQPKNRTIPITFAKPEIVRIECDLHSWMTAWVVVAAHAYYAVTRADGQFSFDGLPPGAYRLQVWHEKLVTVPIQVTVPAMGNASVSVEMKLP